MIKLDTEYGQIVGDTLDEVLTKVAEYAVVCGSCEIRSINIDDSDIPSNFISEVDVEMARRKLGPTDV